MLKQMADILSPPLAAIIIGSRRQGRPTAPDAWMLSRITPVPRTLPVRNIGSAVHHWQSLIQLQWSLKVFYQNISAEVS